MSKVLCLLPEDHLQEHVYDTRGVIRSRRRTDNTMTKTKKTKCQTMVDIAIYRKLRIYDHELKRDELSEFNYSIFILFLSVVFCEPLFLNCPYSFCHDFISCHSIHSFLVTP